MGKSVDKTLKYYKNKIKTLKASYKEKLKANQTSRQRERRVLKNKIKTLQKKNSQLQDKVDEQKYALCKLKSVEQKDSETQDDEDETDSDIEMNNLNIHKIFDYCSNLRKSRNTSIETLDTQHKEIKNVTHKHSLRLQKWMKNTKILMNGCQNIQTVKLSQYSDYKHLMAEQQ